MGSPPLLLAPPSLADKRKNKHKVPATFGLALQEKMAAAERNRAAGAMPRNAKSQRMYGLWGMRTSS